MQYLCGFLISLCPYGLIKTWGGKGNHCNPGIHSTISIASVCLHSAVLFSTLLHSLPDGDIVGGLVLPFGKMRGRCRFVCASFVDEKSWAAPQAFLASLSEEAQPKFPLNSKDARSATPCGDRGA